MHWQEYSSWKTSEIIMTTLWWSVTYSYKLDILKRENRFQFIETSWKQCKQNESYYIDLTSRQQIKSITEPTPVSKMVTIYFITNSSMKKCLNTIFLQTKYFSSLNQHFIPAKDRLNILLTTKLSSRYYPFSPFCAASQLLRATLMDLIVDYERTWRSSRRKNPP